MKHIQFTEKENDVTNFECIDDNPSKTISEIFRNLSDDDIKNLILYSIHMDRNAISVKEITSKVYYHTTNLKSYMTNDDIYTNGEIEDTDRGKKIKHFSIAVIVKRRIKDFTVEAIDVILCGKDDDAISEIKANLLPTYLSPSVFGLFI